MTSHLNACDFSRIIFWEPSYSPHKSEFISAIACALPDVEIIYVADQDLSDVRKSMGWSTPKPNGYKLIASPQEERVVELFKKDQAGTFHVISGLRRVHSIVIALREIKKTQAPFAIMSEPRVGEGWKGKLRYLQSWITEGWIRRNASFILAIGANGPSWFKSVGYTQSKIFPFAYFIQTNAQKTSCNTDQDVRIGYLGRLVKEKGVYDITRACSELTIPYTLIFAGSGKESSSLKVQSDLLNTNTHFAGVLPMSSVPEFISNLDVLILASNTKDDGWGVVISEALLVGTPVIATDNVGASLILDNHILGHVVPPNSPRQIKIAIEKLYHSDLRNSESREIRKKWAVKSLTSEAGASTFIEILNWSITKKQSRPLDFHLKHPIY